MNLFRLLLTLGLGAAAFLVVYWVFGGSTLLAFIVGLIAAFFAFRDHENWRSADALGGLSRPGSS